MEKREIREGLLHAERARKQLIRPKLQELGLTPGQGQVGILNRLLQRTESLPERAGGSVPSGCDDHVTVTGPSGGGRASAEGEKS